MASISLLSADVAALAFGALLGPQWGVYLDGVPVIQPASVFSQTILGAIEPARVVASLIGVPNVLPVTASTIKFDYSNDQPVPTYPQEQGGFQSYNKINLPAEIRVRMAAGGSASARQAFLSTCRAINASLSLFDIVTPEGIYTSYNCVRMSFPRSAESGVSLIAVDLLFQEIRIVGSTDYSSTRNPANAGQSSIGGVQANALTGTGTITVRSLSGLVR